MRGRSIWLGHGNLREHLHYNGVSSKTALVSNLMPDSQLIPNALLLFVLRDLFTGASPRSLLDREDREKDVGVFRMGE